MSEAKGATPNINVTPLIDVLLVLLIIFMVAAPLKPHRFLTKVPSPPQNCADIRPNPVTLVVTIQLDRTLKLNQLDEMGTVSDPGPLVSKLRSLFEARLQNRSFKYELALRSDLSDSERVERTVFIKAPRSIPYGEVTRVIDGLKGAGATPIGLQLDGLN